MSGSIAKHKVGDIVTDSYGRQWRVREDRKWDYIKKPRQEWKMPLAKPKEVWVNNYPPVNLPDHIRPTEFPYYYISNDGVAYREPRRCDRKGRFGPVNEYGLIELTTHLRGNPKYIGKYGAKMYHAVNIYFYDENNKNCGYKKRNIHQLVAAAWVPNPQGLNEVMHMDENNKNNHYTNLKWGTHAENMGQIRGRKQPRK